MQVGWKSDGDDDDDDGGVWPPVAPTHVESQEHIDQRIQDNI